MARFIAMLCATEHLRISPHVWGTGIGLAAALHFLAALPSYPHNEHVPYPPLLEYDVGHNALQNELFTRFPIRFDAGILSTYLSRSRSGNRDRLGRREAVQAGLNFIATPFMQ